MKKNLNLPENMPLADVAKGAHRPPVHHDCVRMICTKRGDYVAQTMMDDPKWLYDRELLVRGYNHIAEAAELLNQAHTLICEMNPDPGSPEHDFLKAAGRLFRKLDRSG